MISQTHVCVYPCVDLMCPCPCVYRTPPANKQVGTKHTPFAVLSRPVAGVRGGTFIVTLPGSPKVCVCAAGVPSHQRRRTRRAPCLTYVRSSPNEMQAVKENLETLLLILPKIFQLIKTATCDHKSDVSPATTTTSA